MAKNHKIFLFDVNHTLINTALYHTKALGSLEKYLAKHIDRNAAKYITERFNQIFLLMVAGFLLRTKEEWEEVEGGKESYENLIGLIAQYQVKVKEQWGFIKKWSREVFLKIAADEIKVHIPANIIYNASTTYWDEITNLTEPFDEAKQIVNYLTKQKYPVYLLTSSDGRLHIEDGYFRYNHAISGNYKKKRMETLREKGLDFKGIIVGDPEDKPLPEYYKRAINEIENDLKTKIDPSCLVMTGNSFEDDLETPMLLFQFGKGFLLDKNIKLTKKDDSSNTHRINNLMSIKEILKI